MTQHTAGRFLRSTGAAALSQGVRVITVFGAQLLLRRFVPDSDYGLWDWVIPVFFVLGAVRDLGLAYHVLRDERRPFGNLLALETIWGGLVVVATFFAAPWALVLFEEPHEATTNVIRLMAVFLFAEGLATVPKMYLEGELKVGRAVLPEVERNVLFVVISCVMAYYGYGVWSMVVAHVASTVVYAVHLWLRVWGDIPLTHLRGQTAALVLESVPLALIWFLILLTRHIDPLILGAQASMADVGNYGFAYYWATIVSMAVLMPAIGRVLFAALVELRHKTDEMFRAFSLSTLSCMAIEVPTACFLFLNADLVVDIVGGDQQWADAPTYLRILCFAPLVDPFTRLGGEVLKTLHWDRLWIASLVLTLFTFGFGGWWLTYQYGPSGMAWINLLPLGGVLMTWGLFKVSPAGFRQMAGELAWAYLVPVPFFAAVWYFAGEQPWLCFGMSVLAAAASFGVMAWRFGDVFVAFFKAPEQPPEVAA